MRWALLFAAFASLLSAEAIKIGVLLPLSETWAQRAKEGVLLRAGEQEIKSRRDGSNNSPAFQGGAKSIEFLFADISTVPLDSALEQFINKDHVQALISFRYEPARAALTLAQKFKVYHIGMSAVHDLADGKYNFIHSFDAKEVVSRIIQYATDRRYQRVYDFTMQGVTRAGFVAALDKQLAENNMALAGEYWVKPGQKDFKSALEKAMESKPDVLIFHLHAPELVNLMQQAAEHYPDLPKISVDMYDEISDIPVVEGNNVFFTNYPTPGFVDKLKAAGLPLSNYIGEGYDRADLLIKAFESGDPQKYLRSLKDYPGAMGLITTNTNGVVQNEGTFLRFQNGQWQILEQ